MSFGTLVCLTIVTTVTATKTVQVERMTNSVTESVSRGGGVVDVEQTWHYAEEFKAILGTKDRSIHTLIPQ